MITVNRRCHRKYYIRARLVVGWYTWCVVVVVHLEKIMSFSSCFLGWYLTIIYSVDELVYNTAENMHPTFYWQTTKSFCKLSSLFQLSQVYDNLYSLLHTYKFTNKLPSLCMNNQVYWRTLKFRVNIFDFLMHCTTSTTTITPIIAGRRTTRTYNLVDRSIAEDCIYLIFSIFTLNT